MAEFAAVEGPERLRLFGVFADIGMDLSGNFAGHVTIVAREEQLSLRYTP